MIETSSPKKGICCWYLRYGKCEPPRPPCRFRHDIKSDDGIVPCCFGATCRLGHASRALPKDADAARKLAYWRQYNSSDNNNGPTTEGAAADADAVIGTSPALRDATLLRSQLEPWPTAVLRERLATVFGEDHRELDPVGRAELMRRLLKHYHGADDETGDGDLPPRRRRRHTIRVHGTPVRMDLCKELLSELQNWRAKHKVNTRPSIDAQSYMILRSPKEFALKQDNSKRAQQAARKLEEHRDLWDLAHTAISETDPDFANNFSALAVTYGFTGSPHIDKQNTGPFYGFALGDFEDGTGGVCVESGPFVVAHVNTKDRLGKIDGRFPHWVAPYKGTRYSLVYYSTWQEYVQPTLPSYCGDPVEDDE